MDDMQLKQLLIQALETERGGVKLYEAAVECAVNEDLKAEWSKYLAQTREHVSSLEDLCEIFEIDANEDTPGRRVVAKIGSSLLEAIKMAVDAGDRDAAEVVAAECITLAETKDH